MSSTQEECSDFRSSSSKKVDRNRRHWTENEEQVLLASMKELIAQGWKSDNGYRAGYLNRVEATLNKEIPNCQLKALPHIMSRLSSWKKLYNSLNQILSRSGIGFNTKGTFKIDCEDDQWEQILKADPNARGMRYKQWPYYDDWKEIFGKDRANGENAEDVHEANVAMQRQEFFPTGATDAISENGLAGMEFDETGQSADDGGDSRPASGTRKRKPQTGLDGVCQLLAEMNESTSTRLERIANRIGYEVDASKARQEVLSQLKQIGWLIKHQMYQVCEMLCFKAERLDIWRGMDLEGRVEYVEHLLNGHGI